MLGRVLRSLMAASGLAIAPAALAAVITVDTTADSGDGNCTLREAIAAAAADGSVDGCTAGSSDDEIDLTGLTGTIDLETGLYIPTNVVIRGPGARLLAIRGSVLAAGAQMIRNDQGATVEIEGLTISDKVGEGFFTSCLLPCTGHLILDRVRVSNCRVDPKVEEDPPIQVDGFGAAMSTNCTEADVTIRDSLFVGNAVTGIDSRGGAIWWAGRDLTIVNSTFSGNSSDGTAGALWVLPYAEGGGEAVLRNVTFSGNSAAAGGTIAANAGGPISVANTVVAQSPEGDNCTGAAQITSTGNNLADDASCAFSGTGDQNEVPSGLEPLADNGGPTDSHVFGLGSALRDAGNPAGCLDEVGAPLLADQRGASRPAGTACDVGAVESSGGCATLPLAGCKTALKAQLRLAAGANPARRQVSWSWKKGEAVAAADLGDPSAAMPYALCVYDDVDGDPEQVLALTVDPGAAWKATGAKGWKYKDKTGVADGVQSVVLRTGVAGKAGAQVAARGANLPELVPNDASEFFDQDGAVTAQLVNGGGACFTSEFEVTDTKRNDALGFEATAR